MPRRQDVPGGVMEVLELLHLRLRTCPNHPAEAKIAWYIEAKQKVGPNAAKLAMMLYEANIPLNQLHQTFTGDNKVSQSNAAGARNVTQTAGGNMTGVNATGTQIIRDIAVYSQDLNQSGAAIDTAVRSALIEATDSQVSKAIGTVLLETAVCSGSRALAGVPGRTSVG